MLSATNTDADQETDTKDNEDCNFNQAGNSSPLNTGGIDIAVKKLADPLPIDLFREEILNKLSRDRLVMIHGETGILIKMKNCN